MAVFTDLVSLLLAAFTTPSLDAHHNIIALSPNQIETFKPYTHYASTAYCQPSKTITWSCGANCEANPSFHPVASGGDSNDVQFWYVGYDLSLETVIVAHQGTETSEILADLTDINFLLTALDPLLFPGFNFDVQAHDGFVNEQAKTARHVLSAVQTAISRFGAKKVTIVGHSLGAAISLLDSVYLPLHISGVTFQSVLYGLPRVGNQAFADYVDAHVASLTHINNGKDPVPILPGLSLGFHHPSGEVHITDSNVWEACPGQDNPSTLCIVGGVPSISDSDESDHDGPYDGIVMGC